ncbi:MAG TPA: Npt1/Npt2 family nucleotide transporter [Chlamydiales bacterium]|nr:Npt1/Npt2 family nucleotide transporter [Chlamydiales bacterium]
MNTSEKWFVFFSMLVGFFISTEYAVTRPASSAIFLSVFSSQAIPCVWLISVPINLFIVHIYNRYLLKVGPLKMIGSVAAIVISVHLFCFAFLSKFPEFIFFQFIFKDIYILLMYKQLWSMIHCTISSSRAKYLYGSIFGVGTLGAVVGSLIPGFFAVNLGSENLFLCTGPLYLLLYFSYFLAYKRSPLQHELSQHPDVDSKESFTLIRRSPFLIAALLLVVFMQVSVGLMDYQFNAHLELNILDKDLRTEYMGRVVGLTNAVSLGLQLVGGIFLIHLFGVKRGHLLVPVMLFINAFFTVVIPTFSMISFAYIFIKSIDFSLFGIIREMLYIPMKLQEKFRAKAIIDVFAYRSSKALVSLCILGLQYFIGKEILSITNVLSMIVLLAWIAFVIVMLYIPKAGLLQKIGESSIS